MHVQTLINFLLKNSQNCTKKQKERKIINNRALKLMVALFHKKLIDTIKTKEYRTTKKEENLNKLKFAHRSHARKQSSIKLLTKMNLRIDRGRKKFDKSIET